MEIKKGEIVIYKSPRGPEIKVKLENDTVWLTQAQLSLLFDAERSVLTKHLRNIFHSGELNEKSNVQKLHIAGSDKPVKIYNLDAIIAVGYRVNSKRATQFRMWATRIVKEHIVRGYTMNEKRLLQAKNTLRELRETISFLHQKSGHELLAGQEGEILNLLRDYSKTLTLLEQFDTEKLLLSHNGKGDFILSGEESARIISKLKKELIVKKETGDLFGQEYGDAFKGMLGNVFQKFNLKELYPSLEEKAAHLLYFTIKDHPFVDGNKRIASFLFVYFLDMNNFLYKKTGEKKINDNALTALALLIAVSDPKEKEKLIKIITNLLKS